MNSCIKVPTVSFGASTINLTGLLRPARMRLSTEEVMVAENSIVCLDLGIVLRISFNSSANPSSSIRSASSRTRISRVSTVKLGEFRIWSIKRPGVAIMTSGRNRSSASWTLRLRPPTAKQNLISVWLASFVATEWHWIANSRVGMRMTTLLVGTFFGSVEKTF